MKLNAKEVETLCEVAIKAAKKAGVMIQSFAGADIKIEDKSSGSSPASQIVTEVDLKSQEIILQEISPTLETYDLGMLIEESDDDLSRFEKDYFWCIDPLDGTLPFVENQPGYAVSIALVDREGDSVLGVIYDPLTQTLYHAIKGAGAFRNETAWVLNQTYTGSYKTVDDGGAVMKACWVLEQAPAYFIKKPKVEEGGGSLWDYAATACLYEEIEAFARDSHGQALELNSKISLFMNKKGVLYASHREVLEEIKSD
jgi:fructose-1,6-bisphosphatase/inositol monophosphatase family enzyme